MTTARQRRSKQRHEKEREKRAAARRLPPVRGHGGRRFQTGGRPGAVRLVGVGAFAQGMARRAEGRRRTRGWRRVGGTVAGVLVAVVLVLWIVARIAGHL